MCCSTQSILYFSILKINASFCFFAGNFSDSTRFPCKHNATDPVFYPCLNSAGAHFVYHLVQKRLWAYERLPIDGMRSVVFHGNSPTLCIGGGNVWVDHVQPQHALCLTPKDALHVEDHMSSQYNLAHYFTQGQILGTCLRLREVSE